MPVLITSLEKKLYMLFLRGLKLPNRLRKAIGWDLQPTILHSEGEPYDVPLNYYENYFLLYGYRDIILRLSLRFTRGSNPRSPNNPRPTSTVPFLRDFP